MYYLSNKNEDKSYSTAVKLGYPILTKKMDNINLTSQRIILRCLSNFFGSWLVVLEHCIDKLGQNYVITQCAFLSLIIKNSFLDKTYIQNSQ